MAKRRRRIPKPPPKWGTQDEVRADLKRRRIADVRVRGEDYPKISERPQKSRRAELSPQQRWWAQLQADKVDAPAHRETLRQRVERGRPKPMPRADGKKVRRSALA